MTLKMNKLNAGIYEVTHDGDTYYVQQHGAWWVWTDGQGWHGGEWERTKREAVAGLIEYLQNKNSY
jgi:hypothetical protein